MEQSQSQLPQTLKPQQMPTRELHEYLKSNVEGDSVLSRYQRTKEALESLKMRLAAEREQLARERFQTSSLYVIASNTNFNYPGYNTYGLPYSYSAPANYTTTNTESFSESTPESANKDQKETQTEVREHLKKIEKICDQELGRMEKSIANLRKVRRFWNNLDFYRPYSVYSARDYRYADNTENTEDDVRKQHQKKLSVTSFSRGGSRNGRRHHKRPNSRTGDDVSDERRQYIETCKQHMKVLEQTKFMVE